MAKPLLASTGGRSENASYENVRASIFPLLIRIPLNFKIRSLTQPNRKFLAAKHPLGDVQHVQRGTLVVFPFVFAYRTSFHPDDKS